MVLRPSKNSGHDSIIAGASFILVNATPEQIWAVMQTIPNWRHIFYNTLSAETISVKPDSKLIKMKIGNSLLKSTIHLSVHFIKKKWEINYELAKERENDVDHIRGWLRFLPQPGGKTLVAFVGTAKVPFGTIVQLMGEKVLKIVEFRVLAVPMRLKKHIEGW
jgi:hypothetical protein